MDQSSTKPLISVLLPVYNGMDYLQLSVNSVLEQTLQNFELLIVDDCSTDGSWEYINSLDDKRVKKYGNEHNKGLFSNLNFLVKKSSYPLIKLWAQDDIMYPHCLSAFVSFHESHPAIGFSYSGREIIDDNGNTIPVPGIDTTPAIISTELHARIAFFTGSIAGNISNVCINREALKHAGPFREDMKISADFDMWVRLAKEYDTGFINEKLIKLRDHQSQLSRDEQFYINHVREDLEVYRNLLSYVKPSLRSEGIRLMRNHKLVFYYTLMVKSFLKGKFGTGMQFFRELSSFDNFNKLTISFLKVKIFKKRYPFISE